MDAPAVAPRLFLQAPCGSKPTWLRPSEAAKGRSSGLSPVGSALLGAQQNGADHGGHRASAQRGRHIGDGGDSARGDDGQGDGVADGGDHL
jgi:hypothetical protein